MAGRTEEITVLVRHVRWPIAGKDFCIVDGTIIGGPSGGDPNDHNQNNQPISLVGNHEPPTDGYRSSQSEESLRELRSQCEYRFFGTWKKHAKYGRQFAFDTFVFARPHSRAAVINYLQKCPHVGHATAVAIWNQFGPDSVRVLRETPQVVADVLCVGGRFNREKAAEAAVKLASMARLESCTMELMELLDGRKFRKTTVARAIKRWGNRAAQMIRDNPYLLMAFPGCGFQLCDVMYLDLAHDPARTKRQVLCAWHACVKDRGGHTWLPFAEISRHIADRISGSGPSGGGGNSGDGIDGDGIDGSGNASRSTRAKPERAIAVGARHGIIATRRDCATCGGTGQVLEPDLWGREYQSQLFPCEACNGTGGRLWVAEGRRARDEECVARKVAEMMRWGADWPALDHPALVGERLSDHQREQLGNAMQKAIGSLGGGPGTGKTRTTACLVQALIDLHGAADVAVCCPTGKAAARCGEALRENGVIGIEPKTIHRTLGVESNEDGEGWRFRHGSRNPFPFRYLIVDEASMVSTSLMANLLAAVGRGTHVLLVGDTGQLLPVEHGAPLRDMIRHVPYGELTEIHRNGGTIVRACKQMKESATFDTDKKINLAATPPQNLKFIEAGRHEAQRRVVEIIREFKDRWDQGAKKLDPIWDVQTVVALNKSSPVSRAVLNEVLQRELNPDGFAVEGCEFRVGDKVIQTKTDQLQIDGGDDDEKVLVANGEFGRVVSIDHSRIVVEFPYPTRRCVMQWWKRDKGGDSKKESADDSAPATEEKGLNGINLDLGYAATCWRMQGSQAKVAIVVVDESPASSGHGGNADRSYLFTGISRAEKLCYIVGRRATANAICKRSYIDRRKTFLSEILTQHITRNRSVSTETQEASTI